MFNSSATFTVVTTVIRSERSIKHFGLLAAIGALAASSGQSLIAWMRTALTGHSSLAKFHEPPYRTLPFVQAAAF